MDRCALFVDAGYVLTDGGMAVHGTRRRESVSWDYAGLVQLLGNLAMERTRLPLLRCYWYEATVEGRRSADHESLADLPGVKLRLSKMRPGRREGVESEIHRDLTALARNKAVSDVMVVSAEEDLAQVIADVQDMGMRVTLLHVADDDGRTVSRILRQECDDIVAINAAQLRPYVELISGAEPPRPDEADDGNFAPRPVMNGNGVNGNGVNGNNGNVNGNNGNGHAPAAGRPAAYAQQSQGRHGTGPQQAPVPPAELPARQAPQPVVMEAPARQASQAVVMEAPQADSGPQERAEAPAAADYGQAADFGAGVDYSAPVDYLDYGPAVDYGPVPDYAAPAPVQAREDIYATPVAVPAGDLTSDRDRLPGRPPADLGAYIPGAVREQYQQESVLREPPGDAGDRLQPVPVALPGDGSAQVRRLPARGAVPGGPGQGQPRLGLPPAPADTGIGQQPGGQPSGGHQLSVGQPTGAQPVVPIAPVVPMDPNGMGYAGGRGGALSSQRPVIPGSGPNPNPQAPPIPVGQQIAGSQQVPGGQQELIGQPGAIGLAGPGGGYPGGAPSSAPGVSLADAVQSAHEEGQAFGESVARDAPALWLEAVLARKPRMPSDLEARLLQGSALPIDFLLHDEVRHALRRGFWDALERARR